MVVLGGLREVIAGALKVAALQFGHTELVVEPCILVVMTQRSLEVLNGVFVVLNPSDSGSEFRTEQPGVGGFKRDTSNRGQTKINCCGCILLLFEINPVSQDHGAAERKARLATVPIDEIGDRAIIAALPAF